MSLLLQSAHIVSLRDRGESEHRARKLEIPPQRIFKGVDPAFLLQPAHQNEISQFLHSLRIPDSVDLIGLNINALDQRTTERLQKIYRHICSTLSAELHAHFVLIAMQRYATVDWEMEKLAESVPPSAKATVIPFQLNPSLIKGILTRCKLIITAQYHLAVFGLSSAVPTIGVPPSDQYHDKMKGLFDLFTVSQFLLKQDEVSELSILARVQEILSQHRTLSSSLQETMKQLSPLEDEFFRTLARSFSESISPSQIPHHTTIMA